MSIWIVNDYLTCIAGTETFWHLLLSIEGTVDKTGKSFRVLADSIENDPEFCDLIIRNASFFRRIRRDCKQIAFLQDIAEDKERQINVCKNADCVVFNSHFTRSAYDDYLSMFERVEVIPIGVNEGLFKPTAGGSLFDNGFKTAIFVGDLNVTKGGELFRAIVRNNRHINFIYVSKMGCRINEPNVKNFPGGINEIGMARLYNFADFSIMCSPVETLHLASIEAALCGKPVIGTRTGWLADNFSDECGVIVDRYTVEAFSAAIEEVSHEYFSPREHILSTPYVWANCKASWEALIDEVLDD